MSDSGIGRRRALARKEGNPAYLEKRAEFVRTATNLFKEKGYQATNLGDIAEAVGADRATIYYYFASKEELLHEAVGNTGDANLEMMRQLETSDLSAVERIRVFIQQMLAAYQANHAQVYVYFHEDVTKVTKAREAWAKRVVDQRHQFELGLVHLLQAGIEEGAFRSDLDVEIVANSLWGMLNWTLRWHRPDHPLSADAIANVFSEIFLTGITLGGQKP